MNWLADPAFWLAVGQIILVDILLGGDNAVVIALACRRLPPDLRTKGIWWGTAGAIALRLLLIFFAISLLKLPGLKLVGAIALVWIGVKLMLPEADEGHGNISGSDKLWAAVRTVIVADLVMSVDNVIGVAGAASAAAPAQQMFLVGFGLLVSIPIIIWGSQIVLKLMDRFPWVITAGAMLLGFIAGSLVLGDPLLQEVVGALPKGGTDVSGALGAALVLALGHFFTRRQAAG